MKKRTLMCDMILYGGLSTYLIESELNNVKEKYKESELESMTPKYAKELLSQAKSHLPLFYINNDNDNYNNNNSEEIDIYENVPYTNKQIEMIIPTLEFYNPSFK